MTLRQGQDGPACAEPGARRRGPAGAGVPRAVSWRNAFPFPRALGLRAPRRLLAGAAAAAVVLAATACSPAGSIESADVPAWKATALPSASGTVLEDAGKILNRDPIVRTASGVPAGSYTLTMTCDGGGKAFFAVSLDGKPAGRGRGGVQRQPRNGEDHGARGGHGADQHVQRGCRR